MAVAWMAPLLAALLSWLVCRRLVRAGGRLMDLPNERSLHEAPVPKGGGIGILAGVVVALVLLPSLPPPLHWTVWLALGVGAFSFLDDLYHLSPLVRFLVQGALAWVAVALGVWPAEMPLPGMHWSWPVALGMAFAWLTLVWMTNLYNFMDGMDGFAGGMAVIGFGALGMMGWMAGAGAYALLCVSVVAANLGFLWFNFPPARLFMGDVGSAALGFLAAGLMLWADRSGYFSLWSGLLAFSPFIVDATVTLLRRLLRGERVWQAHRTHCYQRLARSGWGHRKTVLWEYGLMLLCALSAVWGVTLPVSLQWLLLLVWGMVYAVLMLWVERRMPFDPFTPGPSPGGRGGVP